MEGIKLGPYYLTLASGNRLYALPITKTIFSGRSKFQKIEIYEFGTLGLGLVLDGFVQAIEFDESKYHEIMTHAALLNCERPRKILIIGGGDGGALREFLKYRALERVTLIDIDKDVIEACKKYLKNIHQNCFYERRAKIIIDDGRRYLRNTREKFDIIAIDATDPIPMGPSVLLYSLEFYRLVKFALNKGGVMITQAMVFGSRGFFRVFSTVRSIFPYACALHVYVESFADDWAFVMASTSELNVEKDEGFVRRWLKDSFRQKPKYFNPKTYLASLAISDEMNRMLRRKFKPIRDSEAKREDLHYLTLQ